MELLKLVITLFILQALCISPRSMQAAAKNSKLFREYIGAQFNNIKFSDVPINPDVEFHFILAFAIDYSSPKQFLTTAHVSSIKSRHSNVKVGLSLGGATVGSKLVYFKPSSFHLDGIDFDYEQFSADPDSFTNCIGRLTTTLKKNGVISYASIAPYDDDQAQSHYKALWRSYGHIIDYVNFQFYSYDTSTTVTQFLKYFEEQSSNYEGGKVLVSFLSHESGGLAPNKGFFTACERLKSQQKLHGIFVWCADDSLANGFPYEKKAQSLLASAS
ncbi:hypothetical protein PVL29_007400 [Vitis rotundifolia]|uniref:GH18 domain-containing protein n=1 Tax=Vitis rotundifolia TaxID=103349 RepID=A0AA39A1P3_VITRO|nr:hypothetical protein PVL29_007400 [Vitis rotundifolia]